MNDPPCFLIIYELSHTTETYSSRTVLFLASKYLKQHLPTTGSKGLSKTRHNSDLNRRLVIT